MSARDRPIGPLLEAITAQRTTLLADVAALTPAQRTWRSAPNAWSAVDVIEHLVLAEQMVLGDLATAPDRADRPRRFAQRVRAVLVWLVLRLGVRVSVPAEAMRPTGSASFDTLRERWDAQHHALHAFVGGLDAAGLRRRVFRHPIAGPLDVPQTLRLLSAHLSTHQRQLARIRAERDGHLRG